jgi:hypothetical protein
MIRQSGDHPPHGKVKDGLTIKEIGTEYGCKPLIEDSAAK